MSVIPSSISPCCFIHPVLAGGGSEYRADFGLSKRDTVKYAGFTSVDEAKGHQVVHDALTEKSTAGSTK